MQALKHCASIGELDPPMIKITAKEKVIYETVRGAEVMKLSLEMECGKPSVFQFFNGFTIFM